VLDVGGSGVPGPDDRFRVTSYGLNELVTPNTSVVDPETGTPMRRFGNIFRIRNPHAVIQFVIMAYEGPFSVADDVHPFDWWLAFNPDGWPRRAAQQVQTDAVGGPEAESRSRSNYPFLDGHVGTFQIREVYEGPERNNFDPRFAR